MTRFLLPLLACLSSLPLAAAGLDPALQQAVSTQLGSRADAQSQWHLQAESGSMTVKVLGQAQQGDRVFVLLGGEIADAAHPTPGQAAALEFTKQGAALTPQAMSPWLEVGSFGQPQSEIESNSPLKRPVLLQFGPHAWLWRLNWGVMFQGYGTTFATFIAARPDASAKVAEFPVEADTSGAVASGPNLVSYDVSATFQPAPGQDFYPLSLTFKGYKGGSKVPARHWRLAYNKGKEGYVAPDFLGSVMQF